MEIISINDFINKFGRCNFDNEILDYETCVICGYYEQCYDNDKFKKNVNLDL